ncbi:MAG: enoyl-CoA hydratase/isomerase family protein [Acidobacteriota bacterium]|nr:enoyl-CoA hydratase/isomerase family protein [Acidobacteriota bacterium]
MSEDKTMQEPVQEGPPKVLLEIEDGVAWVTLNRPHRLNAMTLEGLDLLLSFIRQAGEDPEVRALVITGAGEDAFCIGSDVRLLDEAYATRDFRYFRDYLNKINGVFFALEEQPIPTIAMVQGRARAGGFELIMSCDFVFIAEETRIGDAHTPFGHMPGAGATQRLARKIGYQRAMEIIMSGRWMEGPEVAQLGLALEAVPRAELRKTVTAFVDDLKEKTRDSLAHIKRVMLRGWDLPLRDAVQMEIQSYIEYLATCMEPVEIYHRNQEKRRARKREKARGEGGE